MKSDPLISIITPAYNAALTLEECYQSLLSQTYTNWEWVVVDDGSSDDTWARISQVAEHDPRVLAFKLAENNGPAVARNFALSRAKGRFIAFLDADDLWMKSKLDAQLSFMLQQKCAFTYSAYEIRDREGKFVATFTPPERVTLEDLLRSNVIGCLTVMVDRQYFGSIKMPLLRKRQDFGMWLNLLKQSGSARRVPGTLAIYRKQLRSVSSNKLKAIPFTWRVYREVAGLGVIKSLLFITSQLTRGVLSRVLGRR